MKKRSVILLAFVIASVLVFGACQAPAGSGGGSGGSSGDQVTVGWIANWLSHEFYQKAQLGMNAEAERLNVKIDIVDGNGDSNLQLNAAENLISKKVDSILFTCMDQNSLDSIVKKANDANIPIISESLTTDGVATVIGADFIKIGNLMGEWMVNEIKARGVDPKILYSGYETYQECADYYTGFKEVMDASGIEYKMVQVNSEGMKETALRVCTDALTANPDINIIVGINDDATLGALQAYKASGKDLNNLISLTRGFEGEVAARAMMDEGTLTGGFSMVPEMYGMVMVESAYKAALGESLPPLTPFKMVIITKDNFYDIYTKTDSGYTFDLEKSQNPDIKWLDIG